MKHEITIASIVFVAVGAITIITNIVPVYKYDSIKIITNSVPVYQYDSLNNSKYKEIMDKMDDLDKRLKKIENK